MVGFGGGIVGGATVAIVIKAIDEFSKPLTKAQKQLAAVGAAMAAIGVAGVIGINKAIESASNLKESINAVEVVFGEGSAAVLKFGETSAKAVGLSTSAFNQMSAVTGALLKDVGLNMNEVADLTNQLTVRASDLASVFNTDVEDAMSAINQALRGETEAIRRFAGDVTDATLEMFLLSKGINKTVSELTQQEKRLFRVQLIMEQTANVAGDFANTADALANRQRVLSATLENTRAELAQGLLPIMEVLVGVIQTAVEAFSGLSDNTKETIGIIIAVTSVVFLLVGAVIALTVASAALSISLLPFILILVAIIAIISLLVIATLQFVKTWDNVKLVMENVGIIIRNIMRGIANTVLTVWNFIVSTIEARINRIINIVNTVIRALNRIPGVNFTEFGDVDFSKFKGELFEFEELTRSPSQATQQTVVNIENVVGLDAEEISKALSDELNVKTSL